MKIFGINFTTKKELKEEIFELQLANKELEGEYEHVVDELTEMKEAFPFVMGQVVYDVALKNAKGRYTKTNPSIEYSTITEVTVDEKNYFNLVKRYQRNDVFFTQKAAEEYLEFICK